MAVWVVRAGRAGEYEDTCIERGATAIGFGLKRSITEFTDEDALRPCLSRPRNAGQLWRFARHVQVDDLVVMPRKRTREVAVGRIVGEYAYRPELVGDDVPHTRKVDWLATDVPRSDFDQDLLNSLGALMTISQPRADNAEARIERVANVYLGLASGKQEAPVAPPGETIATDPDEEVDIDQEIRDRIVARLRQKFAGGRLEHLVAGILRALDYRTLETRKGADGGVDVVAGKGDLGFGQPRLCVQVKGRKGPVDLAEYDRLRGNITGFGAQHGLLASLGGFTKAVRDRNEQSFFEIRLWGPDELVDRLLETYEELPPDIRTDIPLRDRKVLEEALGRD